MRRDTDSMDELLREFFAEEVRKTREPRAPGTSRETATPRKAAAIVAKVALAAAVAAFIALPFGGVRIKEPSSVAFATLHERMDTGAAITAALVRARDFLVTNLEHGGSAR